MTTISSTTYLTVILKSKQDQFLEFLRNLGFKRDHLEIVQSNGNYYFYAINLSDLENSKRKDIRIRLNESQVNFL